ncbi:putative neural-cadherin 2 [Penaeus monodon]|uniref:putative neural-cadherin 2 n=1 Tax=Penaeus monodon TaxID=6687 RepID=UPI0018A6DB57|nr:putative neural-cadherin 2 [Penaeus monodon]
MLSPFPSLLASKTNPPLNFTLSTSLPSCLKKKSHSSPIYSFSSSLIPHLHLTSPILILHSLIIALILSLTATRLLSGSGNSPLQFSESRYCVSIAEDTPTSVSVAVVSATHRLGEVVRYSITGGNDEGLFTIEQHSGLLTLAAPLDHELHQKHELQVAAEAGGQVMYVIVEVQVLDVNDNVPYFVKPQPRVTVIEEDDRDLPMTLTKVEAWDADQQDRGTLLYTLRGDGVDGLDHDKAYFKVHPHTGDLIQLRQQYIYTTEYLEVEEYLSCLH